MGCCLRAQKFASHNSSKAKDSRAVVLGESDGLRKAGQADATPPVLVSPTTGRATLTFVKPSVWRSSAGCIRATGSDSEEDRAAFLGSPPQNETGVLISRSDEPHKSKGVLQEVFLEVGGDDQESLETTATSDALAALRPDSPTDPRGAVRAEPSRGVSQLERSVECSTLGNFRVAPSELNVNTDSCSSTFSATAEAADANLGSDSELIAIPVAPSFDNKVLPAQFSVLERKDTYSSDEWLTVEVSVATRVLLLTWARWGRNSWRIKEEERIKVLQHVKHPRSCYRPSTPLVSPQSTPRGDTITDTDRSSRGLHNNAVEVGKDFCYLQNSRLPQPIVTNSQRNIGISGRVPHASPKALWVEEMKREQRSSMCEQGTKIKLRQKLGPEATQSKSGGTPMFGIKTPDFARAKSMTSPSPEASIASSGVISPLAGGQMSPWILEAEVLVNGDDDASSDHGATSQATAAWALSPACLEQIPELPGVQEEDEEAEPQLLSLSEDGFALEYGDELDNVQLLTFVEESNACKHADTNEGEQRSALALRKGTSETSETTTAPTSASSPLSSARGDTKVAVPAAAAPRYAPGADVKYFSASHGVWLPARIVEQRSQSVYLIDKQMKGCVSKVHASELVSDAEERLDPVLRACGILEAACGDGRHSLKKAASSSVIAAIAPAHAKQGCIVRDDFSDDSDND